MPTDAEYLAAARADHIPEGWSGLWFVFKLDLPEPRIAYRDGEPADTMGPGLFTQLFRVTDATMHQQPPGECVMEDSETELRTHLEFMRGAHGRVLVTGLGLGCVIRGLLLNPAVDHITCIENSPDVLRLVRPHMPEGDRLAIVEADAREWVKTTRQQFDCAWHDLWTDRAAGEPHLSFWHVELLMDLRLRVPKQGAWGFPAPLENKLRQLGAIQF